VWTSASSVRFIDGSEGDDAGSNLRSRRSESLHSQGGQEASAKEMLLYRISGFEAQSRHSGNQDDDDEENGPEECIHNMKWQEVADTMPKEEVEEYVQEACKPHMKEDIWGGAFEQLKSIKDGPKEDGDYAPMRLMEWPLYKAIL